MDNNEGTIGCALGCWLVAAFGGALVAILLMLLGGWTFMQSVFVGALIFIVVGLLLNVLMCKSLPDSEAGKAVDVPMKGAQTENEAKDAALQGSAAVATAGASTEATDAASDVEAASGASGSDDATTSDARATLATSATSSAVSTAAVIKPSAELKGTQELAQRKGTYKYVKPVDETPVVTKPAGKKTASAKGAAKATKAEAKASTAQKAAAQKAPAKKAAAQKSGDEGASGKAPVSKRDPVAADGKPETLTKARESGADDLKQIKGVGPGLEKTLNELGFFHFDQIAGWRKKEIAWVDSRLKFKGRIERDEWTKQAKVLAKGGATDFSNKVKKGGVY